MAWGGAEEQKLEHEAGNPNAKDWHDEATKIIEKTMMEYWEKMKPLMTSKLPANSPNKHGSKRPLESDFDRVRQERLLRVTVQADNGSWKTELRHYLADVPKDVSKETDIVAWWAVCIFHIFSFCIAQPVSGPFERLSNSFTHCNGHLCHPCHFRSL